MNLLITPDCVCEGRGSVPASFDRFSRLPCGECAARYDRWRETCANADPLALMTAERDALREKATRFLRALDAEQKAQHDVVYATYYALGMPEPQATATREAAWVVKRAAVAELAAARAALEAQ